MGSCTTRHFLLSICLLQLLATIERQIFDFLGYMWAPILANFFHIIFVIFGFFGAYQFSAVYLLFYGLWILLWIGWNSFLVCFHMNVGVLNRDSDILSLRTGAVSWFEVNGYGCLPTYPTNITSEDPFRLVRPEYVEGCLLEWYTIETIQSVLQLSLAVLGLIGSMCIARVFFDDDDRFDFMGGDAKSVQHTVVHPMYVSYTSIPTSTANTTMKSTTKLLTKPFDDDVTNSCSTNSTQTTQLLNFIDFNHTHADTNKHNNINTNTININNTNHNNHNITCCRSGSSNGSVTSNCLNAKASSSVSCNHQNSMFSNNKNSKKLSTHSLLTNGDIGNCKNGNIKHHFSNSHHNINVKHTFSRLHGIDAGVGGGGGGSGPNCQSGQSYAKRNSFCVVTRHTDQSPPDSDSDEFRQMPLRSGHGQSNRMRLKFVPGHRELGASQSQSRVNILRQFNDLSNGNSSSGGSVNASPEKYAHNGPMVYAHERKYVSPRRLPHNSVRREMYLSRYGNEIRDLPPEYALKTYAMKRTQSHDRLINQQRSNAVRRKTRPKSYCSNGNVPTPI